MKVIDTHVHFHDPNWPEGITWPPEDAPHYRTCLPKNYETEIGCRQVIAVETSTRPTDDWRLAKLAKDNDLICCYINNLQPLEKGFSRRLETASQEKKWRGIRLRPIKGYDLNSSELLNALELISDIGHVELGIADTCRLKYINGLCKSLPDVNFVLTHCGHPQLTERTEQYGYRLLEDLNNLYVKLSPPPGIDIDKESVTKRLSSHITELTRILPSGRLMFGSNWPGNANSEPFQTWLTHLFSENQVELNRIMGETARSLYRVP